LEFLKSTKIVWGEIPHRLSTFDAMTVNSLLRRFQTHSVAAGARTARIKQRV